MTVFDNMAFSMKLAGRSKEETAQRVDVAAKILGLTEYLDRYPRQLSGGQRQRVAMGRAIVRNPQVFLFDEPLSNLDAKLRVQMRTEIKELHQRLKTTSVYVTHDQIEAMTMADTIVVMNGGTSSRSARPWSLHDNPATCSSRLLGSPPWNPPDALPTGYAWVTLSRQRLACPTRAAASRAEVPGWRPGISVINEGGGRRSHCGQPTGADTQVHCRLASEVVVWREHIFKPGILIPAADSEKTYLFDSQWRTAGLIPNATIDDEMKTHSRPISSRRLWVSGGAALGITARWRCRRSSRRSSLNVTLSCGCYAGSDSCRAMRTFGSPTPRNSVR
jgi:multiple sugar transport system ATP-binding protein